MDQNPGLEEDNEGNLEGDENEEDNIGNFPLPPLNFFPFYFHTLHFISKTIMNIKKRFIIFHFLKKILSF